MDEWADDTQVNHMRDKEAEKRYLKERAKGASQRKAAKRAGISRPTAVRAEKDPRIKTAMALALERAGCTEDKIAEVVYRNMDATKVISANVIRGKSDSLADEKDGMADAHSMTKDFINVPDGPTQLKAAELAGKFRGDFIEKHEHSGSIGFDLSDVSEETLRRIAGNKS